MQPEPATLFHLTPHERRILRMFVDGENYKSCALRLGVTVNTISYHVRHIYEKLQVHSRSEAVVKALRNGIIAEHTLTTAQRQ